MTVAIVVGLLIMPSSAAAGGSPGAWVDCGLQPVKVEHGAAFLLSSKGDACADARRVARVLGRTARQVKECDDYEGCVIGDWHCRMAIPGDYESGFVCSRDRARIRLRGAGGARSRPMTSKSTPATEDAGDPSCLPADDEHRIAAVAEEVSEQEPPLDDAQIEETFRYPAFRIRASRNPGGSASIAVHALAYRGPAGLYGSAIVPQARFARIGIEAHCPAYLRIERVVHERGCWLTSEGNRCETKWWPAPGPTCDEGSSCAPTLRRVALGRPIHLALPRAPNRGLYVELQIPNYLVPGKCVCVTNHLRQQNGGSSNLLFLH